jgi:hypothetical protein
VAPDLRLSDGSRLKARFGERFVVLLAGAAAETVAAAAELAWPVSVDLVSDPALGAMYAASGPRAWIVRPDGHLAASQPMGPGGLAALPQLVARSMGSTSQL